MSNKPRFFQRRVNLGVVFSRKTKDYFSHWVGSTFTAWRVIETNDENARLSLCVDPANSSDTATPVAMTGWHNLPADRPAGDGVFENSVAQPGVEVVVEFVTEGRFDSPGRQPELTVSTVYESEGSDSQQEAVTATSSVLELIPANDNRIVARLQHKSGSGKIYYGKPAELADANFANICREFTAGDEFEHWGTDAVNFKTDGADIIFSLQQRLK